MTTLILSPRYSEDSQLLWRAAQKLGWDTVRLHGWKIDKDLKNLKDPVIYVEAMMAPMIAEELGINFVEPPEDWLPNLPQKFSKRNITLTTFGQALKALKTQGEFFCKPPNDKAFKAGVYVSESMPKDYPNDMPVLIQEVVRWEKEFRCFIANKKVVTASIYLRNGHLQRESNYYCGSWELEQAVAFAETVLNEVEVPEAVVMDVGYIIDRGMAVVELNAAWGSGIYGCDPEKVLKVLKLCCRKI